MNLFSDFAATTSQKWKEQILKDLKGVDFSQLSHQNSSGITIHPFYTSDDLMKKKAPVFFDGDWKVCEQITVTDEKEANSKALRALNGGANGLSFYVYKKTDYQILLKDISLEHIYAQFFVTNDALHLLEDLKDHYGALSDFDGKARCFVNIDPLSLLAYFGEWHSDEAKDLEVLRKLKHLPVNQSLYQEAGANTVNELAIGLAHLNEYLNYLNENERGSLQALHFTVSVGGEFFEEIAKLRACRQLVKLLCNQYQIDLPLQLHAQTTQINKSYMDAYTNMLRTTTEAMSAVLGGSDSLCVLPFDLGFAKSSDFSARMALNQQHVIKDESYLNMVADVGAGSYYVESLSDRLAEKAWEQFKLIEKEGGFLTCLQNNFIQELIEKDAAILLSKMETGEMVLVGVNKYLTPVKDASDPKSPVTSTEGKGKTIKVIKPMRLARSFEIKQSEIKQ
jgi:methylmalonyl-CoA mutase